MISYLYSFFAFIVFFFSLTIVMRRVSSHPYFMILALLSIGIYFLSVIFNQRMLWELNMLDFTCLYWLFIMAFYFLFFGLYKSISVRILVDLFHNNSLDYSYVVDSYLSVESFSRRLDVLEARNLAIKQEDEYQLTQKGRGLVFVYILIQKIYGIKFSG